MAATIQTIQTPKRARALDTSGNNNHGQIYSGRALEFDGVSDYLQVEDIVLPDLNTFTMAIWVNFPNAFTANYGPCFMIGNQYFNHNQPFGYLGSVSDDNEIAFGINKTDGEIGLRLWLKVILFHPILGIEW